MSLCKEFVLDKYSWCHDARLIFSSIFIASSIFRTFLAKTTTSWRLFSMSEKSWRRMLMIKERISTSFQKNNFCKHILTMIFRNLLKTTEKHCLKSSQKHIIFFFQRNSLVNIADVRKNTTDDHEISFSLHRDFVSKNQFDFFNKLNAIHIFFDWTNTFTLRI